MRQVVGRKVIAALIVCSTLSCGSESPRSDAGDHGTPTTPVETVPDNEPKMLEIFDGSCTQDSALKTLGVVPVWQWNGEVLATTDTDFSEVNGAGLTSEFSGNFQFGSHSIDHIECKGGCEGLPFRREIIAQPSLVAICRTGFAYDRNSIESASLSILSGIHRLGTYYRHLDNHGQADSSLAVNVLPLAETIFHNKIGKGGKAANFSRFVTDNANWRAQSSTRGAVHEAIVVYPHSKEMGFFGLTGEDVRFWEIPVVLGHEYSHHIFYSLAPRVSRLAGSIGLSDLGGGLWPPREVSHETISRPEIWPESESDEAPAALDLAGAESLIAEPTAELGDKGVQILPILEAYADLLAQYSQTQIFPYKNIRCFQDNRDLAGANFANASRTPKVLTAAILNVYRQSSGRGVFQDCNEPSAANAYSIASILAYGINEILSAQYGGDLSNRGVNKLKGEALVRWAKVMEESFTTRLGARSVDIIPDAIDQLLMSLLGKSTPSAEFCSALNRGFPFIQEHAEYRTRIYLSSCPSHQDSVTKS